MEEPADQEDPNQDRNRDQGQDLEPTYQLASDRSEQTRATGGEVRDDTRLVPEQDLAATYSPPGYASAWDAVEAFREWSLWQAQHPEAGRARAAAALEMPEGRIRTWQDGGMPDPVQGIQTAKDRGWVNVDPTSTRARGLVELLAWVNSSGSLPVEHRSRTMPSFSVRDESELERLEAIGDRAGVEWRLVHEDCEGSGREAQPATAGNVLGRVLRVLGAKSGAKAEQYTSVPGVVRRYQDSSLGAAWLRVYLRNRGGVYEDRPNRFQLQEERDERYLRSLAQVVEAVLEVEVTVGERGLFFDAAAAQSLLDG